MPLCMALIHMFTVKSKVMELSAKNPNSGVDDPSFRTEGGSGVGRNLLLFLFFNKGFPIIHLKAI